jgi:hypothetical protein
MLIFKKISTAIVYVLIGVTPLMPVHASRGLLEDDAKSQVTFHQGLQPSTAESDAQSVHNANVKDFLTFVSTIDLDAFDTEVERDIKNGHMGIDEIEDMAEFLYAAGSQLVLENQYDSSTESKFRSMFSILLTHHCKLSPSQ